MQEQGVTSTVCHGKLERNYRSSLTAHKRNKIDPKPFDSVMTPPRQNLFLLPFVHLICWLNTVGYGLKIKKENMEGIKPPYLLLGSHHSFMDFYVTPLAVWPHRANYISELEGFEAFGEWIYRQVGCLGTRKFISDLPLVRNIKKVVDRGDIIVIYPEARYSNVGTNSRLTLSLAKLARMLHVPVVTLVMNGNHLQSPIWNLTARKEVRLRATMKCVLTPEQMAGMSASEILDVLQKELTYDDYKWQRETGLKISFPKRAEGLHKPLYMCRECGGEFCMESEGAVLRCKNCRTEYTMDEYGTLHKADGSEIFIPDYYEWERQQVHAEMERGGYKFDQKVRVEALPNSKNFIALGEGRLRHTYEGFYLTFKDYMEEDDKTLFFDAKSSPSIHTEYDYRGEGQCVTLSTPDCTYFLFPLEEAFNATKIQFATEYLYWKSLGKV
ncbi:MAG: 1-acyl-sn-glycerol-3-phosphate acyltransferase [Treponema sp.]|nr:1-acyl-sn-glycerol-3-phosphate acyltransferase [Treponema sp.]